MEIEGAGIPYGMLCGLLGMLLTAQYIWTSYLSRHAKRMARLPPGPKPKPLIGNLPDLPDPNAPAEPFWTRHRDLYGPISSLSMLGKTIIVINSAEVAYELMEKRNSKYSGRPEFPFAGDVAGWRVGWIFQQHNDTHRTMRKMAHSQLGSYASVDRWKEDIEVEGRHFLLRLLDHPEDFVKHLKYEAGAIILKICYGYTSDPSGKDPLIDLAGEIMHDFERAIAPGEWLVDSIPALKHVPDWMPGANFKRIGRAMKHRFFSLTDKSYNIARKKMAADDNLLSLVSGTHKKMPNMSSEEEQMLKYAALALYTGGSDTTVCVMEIFFLVMTIKVESQQRAQAEIDAVIGTHRLPRMEDRQNLPFVEALYKEILRWKPLGSLGVPHRADADDEYEGYFIPKNAVILPHIAGMLHDPAAHVDPFEWNPDRFLGDKPERDPQDNIFGHGRRLCPGRFLAQRNMWLEIAQTLAAFNIRAVKGEEPKLEFLPGTINHPVPFKADIRPRSAKHEELIRGVEVDHPLSAGDAHLID